MLLPIWCRPLRMDPSASCPLKIHQNINTFINDELQRKGHRWSFYWSRGCWMQSKYAVKIALFWVNSLSEWCFTTWLCNIFTFSSAKLQKPTPHSSTRCLFDSLQLTCGVLARTGAQLGPSLSASPGIPMTFWHVELVSWAHCSQHTWRLLWVHIEKCSCAVTEGAETPCAAGTQCTSPGWCSSPSLLVQPGWYAGSNVLLLKILLHGYCIASIKKEPWNTTQFHISVY